MLLAQLAQASTNSSCNSNKILMFWPARSYNCEGPLLACQRAFIFTPASRCRIYVKFTSYLLHVWAHYTERFVLVLSVANSFSHVFFKNTLFVGFLLRMVKASPWPCILAPIFMLCYLFQGSSDPFRHYRQSWKQPPTCLCCLRWLLH